MNSRDCILSRLRMDQETSLELPVLEFPGPCSEMAKQFTESVKSVGGECFHIQNIDELKTALSHLEVYKNARKVLSRVSTIPGNIKSEEVRDPHQLGDLDVVVLPGVFGVAENAAVWLDSNCLGRHRAVFVLAQHLVLMLNSDQIVPTMHDAYERMHLNDYDFGVFVSGPSKTADIEQCLVIGAHGARTCTVFLLDKTVIV